MRPTSRSWPAAPDTFISCYPNAGLPNPMSDTGFDETPDVTSSRCCTSLRQKAWSTSAAAAAHTGPHPGDCACCHVAGGAVQARRVFRCLTRGGLTVLALVGVALSLRPGAASWDSLLAGKITGYPDYSVDVTAPGQ
jgi:hypothetical protein